MDSHAVKARLAELGAMVEARLQGFADASGAPRRLKEAMAYSLMAGGKRLRPVLLMSAASLFGTPADKVLPFACAVADPPATRPSAKPRPFWRATPCRPTPSAP